MSERYIPPHRRGKARDTIPIDDPHVFPQLSSQTFPVSTKLECDYLSCVTKNLNDDREQEAQNVELIDIQRDNDHHEKKLQQINHYIRRHRNQEFIQWMNHYHVQLTDMYDMVISGSLQKFQPSFTSFCRYVFNNTQSRLDEHRNWKKPLIDI